MMMKIKNRKNRRGFSVVEIVIVLSIMMAIGYAITVKMGGTVKSAKGMAKAKNAEIINSIIEDVIALGGSVQDGAGADIDTTSLETIFDSLMRDDPLEIMGVTFEISKRPNKSAYELDRSKTPVRVIPLENSENA